MPTPLVPSNRSMSRVIADVPIWVIPCYSIILLCAVVGNLLVVLTLVQNRRMRTITNVFLLNLAISDILLGVLCMPVTLVGTLLRNFIFGETLCKLFQFAQGKSADPSPLEVPLHSEVFRHFNLCPASVPCGRSHYVRLSAFMN